MKEAVIMQTSHKNTNNSIFFRTKVNTLSNFCTESPFDSAAIAIRAIRGRSKKCHPIRKEMANVDIY